MQQTDQSTQLVATHDQDIPTLPSPALSTGSLVLDGDSLDRMMRLAEIMATGVATLPKHFHNNPADCLAVIMQSMQWGMNPFAVGQKTHLINGVLGYEAQLVNAVINSVAPVKDRLHYEWFGDWSKVIGKFEIRRGDKGEYRVPGWKLSDETGLGVRVWATLRGEDEPRVLELLLAQARTRNSTLWADDPKQQLAYLAIKRWSRLYCPDVILGVYTPDELEETRPREKDITPPRRPAEIAAQAQSQVEHTDELKQLIAELESIARENGEEALAQTWKGLTREQRRAIGAEELERLKGVAFDAALDRAGADSDD